MSYRRTSTSARNQVLSRAEVNVDGLHISIIRKPIRNVYLRLKPPNADVVISAPPRLAQVHIIDFVRQRRPWIDQHRNEMLQSRQRLVDGQNGKASRNGDANNQANIISGSSGGINNVDIQAGIENSDTDIMWTPERMQRAKNIINQQLPALLATWEPIIGRRPTHITLRAMKTRWGSCTPATGRIRLNLQLGIMEPKFLEYVLVHEMTHLWEKGHGEAFQRRMDQYLPQWRTLRNELNRCVVIP